MIPCCATERTDTGRHSAPFDPLEAAVLSPTQTQQAKVTQITTNGCIHRLLATAVQKYPLTHLAPV